MGSQLHKGEVLDRERIENGQKCHQSMWLVQKIQGKGFRTDDGDIAI